jgi:16S rRNA (guanine527-N7)-methyltransferase
MVEQFAGLLENLGITLTKQQEHQFKQYYTMLLEWNNKLNLTSITEEQEVYVKHFYDSICLLKSIELHDQTLLDVGSGAGFPSIPLKIVFPSLKITILDALQKRIHFLEELVELLGLDIELIHGRAEEFDRREQYDIVTARAVANLRMLSELCIPFVRVNGYFLAMKGPNYDSEVEESKRTFTLLNATLDHITTYQVEQFERSIVAVKKTGPTNIKYPRKFNKIKSKPL